MSFSDAFLDEIRARLMVSEMAERRVKLTRRGAEFVGLSPFKDEKSPSFTVNDEKGFYHCFSSGKHGDVFAFVMETEGVDFPTAVEICAAHAGIPLPKDSRPAPRQGSPSIAPASPSDGPEEPPFDPDAYDLDRAGPGGGGPSSTREITRTYDYTDAGGNLLYQVCRIEWQEDGRTKKTFLQRRPGPGDGWIWGLKGGEYLQSRGGDWYQATRERLAKWTGAPRQVFPDTSHGLYRLQEMREEVGADTPIVIPEGEKDVETWRTWGHVAVTNSGGARHWTDAHAEEFRGRDVILPIDNDEPGRARANILGKSLRKHGARSIKVIDFAEFWQEAKKGADTTDWAEAFPDRDAAELIKRAKPWVAPPFVSRFGGYPFEDLDLPGPEFEFVVDGWMTVGDKSVIGGASRSGKSFLATFKAWCIATGRDFFGNRVLKPGLVIYQAGEGARGIKKRFRALRQYFGVTKGQRVPLFILQSKIDLYSPTGDTPALIEEIKAIADLYDVPLRAIFIDTLATASGTADENSGRDMSTVMTNIDRIAQSIPGAHVCLVHHLNANGTKLRGHTSIYANIDQVIMVTKDEDSKVRTALLDKQKDEEDGLSIRFELEQVELGRRELDGKPITSCVPVPVGGSIEVQGRGPKKDRTMQLSDQHQLVLNALKRALEESGEPTPATLALPKSITRVVLAKHWKQAYAAVTTDTSDNAINQALSRTSKKLQNLGIIGRLNPYVWLTTRAAPGLSGTVQGDTAAGVPFQEEFPDEIEFSPR